MFAQNFMFMAEIHRARNMKKKKEEKKNIKSLELVPKSLIENAKFFIIYVR